LGDVKKHNTTPVIVTQIPQVEKNKPPIQAKVDAIKTNQLPVKYRTVIRMIAKPENGNQNNGDDISGTIDAIEVSRGLLEPVPA